MEQNLLSAHILEKLLSATARKRANFLARKFVSSEKCVPKKSFATQIMPPSFNIKATNLTLTPELRDFIERRFETLAGLVDFAEPTLKVQVEVGRTTRHHDKGDVYRAEFNVRSRRGVFRTVAERSDIHTAVGDARDELEMGLGRAKGRYISFMRRSRRAMKEMLRGWYGASIKFARIPRFRLPRFAVKMPSLKWKWWRKKK